MIYLGFEAAILNFRLPVSSDNVCFSIIDFLDLEKIGIADGILLLFGLQPDIQG